MRVVGAHAFACFRVSCFGLAVSRCVARYGFGGAVGGFGGAVGGFGDPLLGSIGPQALEGRDEGARATK